MAKGDGVPLNSPRFLALKAAIECPEGQAAMKQAAADGDPPLKALDAMLTGLIVNYADHQTLRSAGSIVTEWMIHQGYKKGPQKKFEGCSAKGGATFISEP